MRGLIKIYLSSWFTTFARTDLRGLFTKKISSTLKKTGYSIGLWALRFAKRPSSTGAEKKTRMNVACGTARCHSRDRRVEQIAHARLFPDLSPLHFQQAKFATLNHAHKFVNGCFGFCHSDTVFVFRIFPCQDFLRDAASSAARSRFNASNFSKICSSVKSAGQP